ncbi:hypothetical protein ACSQ67_023685 [Phaseolus vulgaris]
MRVAKWCESVGRVKQVARRKSKTGLGVRIGWMSEIVSGRGNPSGGLLELGKREWCVEHPNTRDVYKYSENNQVDGIQKCDTNRDCLNFCKPPCKAFCNMATHRCECPCDQ